MRNSLIFNLKKHKLNHVPLQAQAFFRVFTKQSIIYGCVEWYFGKDVIFFELHSVNLCLLTLTSDAEKA